MRRRLVGTLTALVGIVIFGLQCGATVINWFGFHSDVTDLTKWLKEHHPMLPNGIVYLALAFCLAVTIVALAPARVRSLLLFLDVNDSLVAKLTGVPAILPMPSPGPPPPAAPDPASLAHMADACHFALRCETFRGDAATFALAEKIGGTREAAKVRHMVFRFLYLGDPRPEVIDAIWSLYASEGTTTDVPILCAHSRHVAAIARVEYRPTSTNFQSYLIALLGILARHLGAGATILDADAQDCRDLIAGLHKRGFGELTKAIALKLGMLLRVEPVDPTAT